MNIEQAQPLDVPGIVSVLLEAEQWLARDGKSLWSATEIGPERVLRDVGAGLFHVARDGLQLAGVVKFELEDAYFWPDVREGSSAFVHKLAVRREWAKMGVSTELLSYARILAERAGRAHLRLDCMADREGLRNLYEGFGFTLHSVIRKGSASYARYEIQASSR